MFEKLIDNKPAVFLALAFSNIMKVNVSLATDEMNIDAFNYFLDELSSEYIECVDTSYIPAKHLLDSSYFIKPIKSDVQIYNDIINACQPVYLYKDQVLATLYDNTVAVSLINNKKKLDRDIKDIITNSLVLFSIRANNIENETIKHNMLHNISFIAENTHKLTLIKNKGSQ